jgi:hypothetical protein
LLGNFPSLSATLGITRIAPVAFHINVNSSWYSNFSFRMLFRLQIILISFIWKWFGVNTHQIKYISFLSLSRIDHDSLTCSNFLFRMLFILRINFIWKWLWIDTHRSPRLCGEIALLGCCPGLIHYRQCISDLWYSRIGRWKFKPGASRMVWARPVRIARSIRTKVLKNARADREGAATW